MANLLRLALQRPDLFREPRLGSDLDATASDIALIRRAGLDEPLGSIIRRVYPEVADGP